MKTQHFIRTCLVFIGFGFFSCEKNATIPLPKSEKKMVITCFLSPDEDSLTAEITWTKPIFGANTSGQDIVTNANVRISGPDGTANFTFDKELGRYILAQNQINLKYGSRYEVSASHPSGSSIKGSCTIPERFDPGFETSVSDSTFLYEDGFGKKIFAYSFKVVFMPKTPGKSWYRIGAYQRYLTIYDPGKPANLNWSVLDYNLDSRFFISEKPAENPFSIVIRNQNLYEDGSDSNQVFRFILIQGDKSYYDFHQSVFNFEGENPFAEPVRLYTNVEGGLGVVASYLKDTRTIEKP